MTHTIASIVPELFLEKTFDYAIPEHMRDIKRSARVCIPFGRRTLYGFVLETKKQSSHPKLKTLLEYAATPYPLTEELFELALWMSRYYITPLSQVLKVLLPSAVKKETKMRTQVRLKKNATETVLQDFCRKYREKAPRQVAVVEYLLTQKEPPLLSLLQEELGILPAIVDQVVKKGLIKKEAIESVPSFFEVADFFPTKPKKLLKEQKTALEAISEKILSRRFSAFLLHGVTGSGKTEVFLQAMEKALSQEQNVLYLIPEISLTPQTVQRIRSRFSFPLTVLHHRLSAGERNAAFQKICNGNVRIVIGARSSIFAPLQNIGLIIVDEEHDSSYKQSEEMPHYNARDLAVYRAHLAGCPVVLGSATPSVESFYNGSIGKYCLLTLSSRANEKALPPVHFVDMRREYEKQQGFTNFSSELIEALKQCYHNGQQALLFLNRRGYHSMQLCLKCGEVQKCSHCDHSLTYYKSKDRLQCHLCGFSKPVSNNCSYCGSLSTMKFKGVGTELVEKQLKALLPDLRILRLDADSTRHKGSLEKYLKQFATGKADVLIGTQMIAKGHDFQNVTLVGILNADTGLHLPDFRAQETTFQLITQVAGRAGRGAVAGEVFIQTTSTKAEVLQYAARQDYLCFYEKEIEARKMLRFPPFSHMIKVRLQGKDERTVESLTNRLHETVSQCIDKTATLHPVLPSAYKKVQNIFTYQFIMMGQNPWKMSSALLHAKSCLRIPASYKIKIDVNPQSTYF